MIQLNLTPIQHALIIDSLNIAKKQMLSHDLTGSAEMIIDLMNEISLGELDDKSKKVNEKD